MIGVLNYSDVYVLANRNEQCHSLFHSLQLIIFKEDSSSFEYRIQSLTEEVETLRKSVVEKDTTISKLRIEMRESADKMSRISSFVCACTHS